MRRWFAINFASAVLKLNDSFGSYCHLIAIDTRILIEIVLFIFRLKVKMGKFFKHLDSITIEGYLYSQYLIFFLGW